jgi:hypothetical protein
VPVPTTIAPVQEREVYIIKEASPGTIPASSATATSATPCVFTPTSMVFAAGQGVVLGGTPPAGFSTGAVYYVVNPTATTFQLAATPGGSALGSTSTGSAITVNGIGVPIPVTTFKPADKPIWIKDESMQGHMGDNSGIYQGPLISGFDIGGHITADVFPHFLYNLLGDYTVSGTAASPAGTTNAAMAAGATTISVASGGASFTAGMYLWLEDAGSPAANEVVQVTATGSSTSIPITPTRFAHATGMPFTNTAAPYTHVNALLNGSVGAANGPAQGPTHCITDRQGLTANGAAQYAYCCISEVTITGNAEKLLDWSAKGVCFVRSAAAAAVGFTGVSSVQPYPSWRSVVGVGGPASGGTQRKEIAEWALTLTRALKPYNTNQGAQNPYVIGRGKQAVAGKMTVLPAIDESYLIALLANTQPQLQFLASNGLGGANSASVQADLLLAAYQTADLQEGSELFGYEVPFDAAHTNASSGGITTTGASGGKSAIKVTVINAVPTY